MTNVDRRTFIAVGTAAIAGLATTGLHAQTAQGEVVSVGFRPFVARGRAVNSAKGGVVYDASSVSFTEPSLMRTGAQISIRGASTRSKMALDVLHHADNLEGKVVFHAWGSGSNALSFRVPVELEHTLDIAVTVGKNRQVFAFSVGSTQDVLKFNSGKYIFAVGSPSWSDLRMEKDVLKILDGSPVTFDYVVVSVSSAS